MNELLIAQIGKDALRTALLVAGPALVVSLVVGLLISVFQVVTSLQDQTIAFVPKVVAVMVVVAISFPWMLQVMLQFTTRMFTEFNGVVRQLN
ncbi:flagellar biosynthetic protein FliQ [Geothrix oryzae]|jgi:flagellar biosynthetic protein FliQ|uniref:Flagellar biosynthetic protein FliQ n=1 Tax=Geothrix oryzae TaxID=2927975 RepID=A0ABM8DR68_9BACT|nr:MULTISPECIES: flagellar biosynthesis protein FliQ [Geothrix]BDU69517.1 flagellar biosynthetic protein FliQ [Geothrix oryzae]